MFQSRTILNRLFVLVLASSPLSAATLTFTDATFLNGDWSAAKIIDTTAGATADFVAEQSATGGNPDAYRQVQHTFDAGNIAVGHLRSDAIYDPSVTGAIQSIAYSYDLSHLNPPTGQAVGYSVVAYQNATYYRTVYDNTFAETWTAFGASGLIAANFVILAGNGPANPDFSASGAPITFGYASANSNTGGSPGLVRLSGIDNWQVSVTAVPLPSAVWLLGTAVASIALRGAKKRKRSD